MEKKMKKTQEINDVCKEFLTILAFCDTDIIKKIPSKILKRINELAADSELKCYIDRKKDLIDQDISEKSKDLIALLYYSYIATENEKNELSKIWNDNEKKYQKELNEKYNHDNIYRQIFERKSANINNVKNNNTALIDYKESFFTKLKNFVFRTLHINN